MNKKYCESCGCNFTKNNIFVSSTNTCIACRDELLFLHFEEEILDSNDSELIKTVSKNKKYIKKFKEPEPQGWDYYTRMYE